MNNEIIEAAFNVQLEAEKFATENEGKTLPYPPGGLPHLRSINGEGMRGALVLGYIIGKPETVINYYDAAGNKKKPGDADYLDAALSRFYSDHKMPIGWRMETTTARFVYALVKGNPILLEKSAKKIGYASAIATSPTFLRLCEYANEPFEQ